jgi:CysZ protein
LPGTVNTNVRVSESGLLPSPFYLLRGAGFLWRHRVLWKYAAAPVFISALILGLSYVILYHFFFFPAGQLVPEAWYWQILYYFLMVTATLILLVVFFFLVTRIASALAAPFNDVISQKTEEIVSGRLDETPFSMTRLLKDSGRGIAHSFKILGIYIGMLILALPLFLLPGIGAVLYSVVSVLLASYMLSYEYLGYPMDRRRVSFREKRRFLRSHIRSTIGFGLGSVAAASIPFVNLMMIPAAVVGGTLLFMRLTPEGKSSTTDRAVRHTGDERI